jgi:hypothetical protein
VTKRLKPLIVEPEETAVARPRIIKRGVVYLLRAESHTYGADKSLAVPISNFPVCSTTKRIFLAWVKEVRTTKS